MIAMIVAAQNRFRFQTQSGQTGDHSLGIGIQNCPETVAFQCKAGMTMIMNENFFHRGSSFLTRYS